MPTFEVVPKNEKTGRVFVKKEDAAAVATRTCRIMVWERGKKIATMIWTGEGWKDRSGRRVFEW